MSKTRKISGQATSLGVASLVAIVGWCSMGMAQDATAPAAKPATPAVPASTAKKPTTAPGAAIAVERKAPVAGTTAAASQNQDKAQKGLVPPGHPGPEGKGMKGEHDDKTSKDDKDGKDDKKGEKSGRPKLQPVSRKEAVKHYREALKELLAVEQPSDLKSDAAAEARKERREAMRELRRARDEILRAHNDSRRDFQKRDAEEVEGLRKKIAKRTAELRKDRKDRAKAKREEVEKIVGDQALHPSVREELRNHAWRIARLNQLVYLAELDNKPKIGEKAKELIEKENTSHEARLKALLAKAEVKNYKAPAKEESELKARPGIPQKLPAGHPPIPSPAAKPAAQPAAKPAAQPTGATP